MTRSRILQRDEEAQMPGSGIILLIAVALVFVGLLLAASGSWSIGIGCIGVGCLLGGFGGVGSIETPWGTIVGSAGVILIVIAFAVNQIFHR